MWQMRCLEAAVVTLLVAAGTAGGIAPSRPVLAGCVGAAVVVVGAVCAYMLRQRFRSWAYQEREDDLVVSRGVMFRRQ